MPKIVLFNIQKLTSPTKLDSFLHHIHLLQTDIIALTEYDQSQDPEVILSITHILDSSNYTALSALPHSRVQIYVSTRFYPSISSQNTFRDSFPSPHNLYIQDFNFTFEGIPSTFIVTYVPCYHYESALNSLTTITQESFFSTFKALFLERNPSSPIICGDWNTLENHPISSFLATYSILDSLTKLPRHFSFKPTNISGTGSNRRLDRFYIHTSILNFHKIKYKIMKKLPFSTHLPVFLNLKEKTRRKKRHLQTTITHFSSHIYSQRPTPFPHHIQSDSELMQYIFTPTPLWEDNPTLSFSYYTEVIQQRLKETKS